jgi:hypothetical protein
MNNKQLTLFCSALLVSTSSFAQSIKFTNGNTLNVELVYQTDKTVTFFDSILGEQTVDKDKISNLQTLNLKSLKKLTESELDNYKKVKLAEEKIIYAKDKASIAEAKLLAAKESVDQATATNRANAEEKLILAGQNFTTATEELKTAENELKVTKDIIVAEAKLSEAKSKVDLAKAKVAQVGEKSIAEELGIFDTDAVTEEAEENVNSAEQQVVVAYQALIQLAFSSF